MGVDYAYAMTTLTILCQFFVGIVALPKPSRWSPPFCRWRRVPPSSEPLPGEARRSSRGGRSPPPWGWGGGGVEQPGGYDWESNKKAKLSAGWRAKRVEEGLVGADIVVKNNSICDPV